ncbi:asparagine synthetase B family protein [Pseudomonas paralcaligenes]|uniref:asparagine synthetase B family protein n=1 Tax=Pseudomonas paralcaligenes TaxID=2772558 RepID=UPI001C7F2DB7|nr:asparagine synthase-related protein [Pseudomonas paralcaligenes]
MSAIAGLIRLDRQAADRATLERMQALLTPYGRDAQRQWRRDAAGLLHTLLRSTPEDSFDQQPLAAPGGDCVLLFDGRLDNRAELAGRLGLSPADSARLADSELVLHACLRWDTRAPEQLCGPYALACWQPARQRLWLARDPMGGRPLFWHRQAGFFAFASLPKALFCIPGVPRSLCEERLLDQLALLPMKGPESFYKDIYRVEPGQLLILDGERLDTRRFHRFDPEREIRFARDDDYLEAFREHLEQAIASCLRSSGPIASHLSSGFDSSTVTALAARQLARREQRLTAYTAVPREGFDGPLPKCRHGDEGPAASALAARFGNIDHVLIRPGDASALDHLQYLTEAVDRVAQNPCNSVWTQAIKADAAARGCRVLLTGQKGNMSISYSGETYLPALWRSGHWLRWWRELHAYRARHPQSGWRGLLARSLAPSLPGPLWTMLARRWEQGSALTDYSAIHPEWMQRMNPTERARTVGWDLSYRPWHDGRRMRIAALERQDAAEYALATNLQGLEIRDPTADLRLVEFCLAVPDHQYLRDGQNRWLLRRLMADVLPPEILDSRSKDYQAADWYEGLERNLPRLREELQRLAANSRVGEMLDVAALQHLLEHWPQSGDWASARTIQAYRLKLLRGLAAGHFIRHVEGDNR